MSNPYEEPPVAQPDPWHIQTTPPQLAQQQAPDQHVGQPQWQPFPTPTKQSNGLAITALVVACVALLLVLGLTFFVVVTGFFSSTGGLQGTAPTVVAGEPYRGALLADEVSRVISGDGGDVGSMTCAETPPVDAGVVVVCHGVVDGFDSKITLTFEDGLGHFTLVES